MGVICTDMISYLQDQLTAKGSGGNKGGGGRVGGKGSGGKGSGWLNKAVPLAVAVISEQHEVASQLAEEVYVSWPEQHQINKHINIYIYTYKEI